MRFALVLLGLITALAMVPPAHADDLGAITDAYHNADYTMGSATMSMSFDACGLDGSPTCSWWAWAVATPTAFDCVSMPPILNYPNPSDTAWFSAMQTADGSTSITDAQFAMNGAPGQKVCLYFVRKFSGSPAYNTMLAASAITQDAPAAPTPAPLPPPTPTQIPLPAPTPIIISPSGKATPRTRACRTVVVTTKNVVFRDTGIKARGPSCSAAQGVLRSLARRRVSKRGCGTFGNACSVQHFHCTLQRGSLHLRGTCTDGSRTVTFLERQRERP